MWVRKSLNNKKPPFLLRMPGNYIDPDDENSTLPLINFKCCPDIRIDNSILKSPSPHTALVVLATHFNQLFGRIVFNSYELFALYFCNAMWMESQLFCEEFIDKQPDDFDLSRPSPCLFDNNFKPLKFEKIL